MFLRVRRRRSWEKQWSNARSLILFLFCFGGSLYVQGQVKSLHFIVNIVYISLIFKGNRKMGIKRSMRHFNFAHQGPLYPWLSTTEPLFSTSWNHNFHNTNYKLSVRNVLGLQECFWLFLISLCVCVCAVHWLFNKTSQPCLRF